SRVCHQASFSPCAPSAGRWTAAIRRSATAIGSFCVGRARRASVRWKDAWRWSSSRRRRTTRRPTRRTCPSAFGATAIAGCSFPTARVDRRSPRAQTRKSSAIVEQAIRPEDIAPAVGERIADEDLPSAFNLTTIFREERGSRSYKRIDGHLFILIEQRGALIEPDRIRASVPDRRPGETAFVLTRTSHE